MCDFEKQGSLLILTIKTEFFIEFVRKCIYSGFLNTVLYVHDIIVRYDEPQKHFLFKKSSGNLEILISISSDVHKSRLCYAQFVRELRSKV